MALAPLSVWCRNLPPQDLIKAVREFTILIHPSEVVVLTNAFYTLMLTYFLKDSEHNEGSRMEAFIYAKAQIQ